MDGIRRAVASGRSWDFFINLSGADVALKTPYELQRYLFTRLGHNMLWANHFDAIDETLLDTHLLNQSFVACYRDNKVIKLPYRKQQKLWFAPMKGQLWMTLTR